MNYTRQDYQNETNDDGLVWQDGAVIGYNKKYVDWLRDKAVKNLTMPIVVKSFYCQSEIEDNGKCDTQCEHCKEYYKPLEQ